jgi:hypothetical protein
LSDPAVSTPWNYPLKSSKPVTSVQDALELVDLFDGAPEDFQLAIPETLLDPLGINMAIITDRILARGWQPDGFTQAPGYRIYRYKALG